MPTTKAFIRKYSAEGPGTIPTVVPEHLVFLLNPANYSLSLVQDRVNGNADKNKLYKKLEVKMNINITTDEMKAKFAAVLALAWIPPTTLATMGVAACEEFFKSFARADTTNDLDHQPDMASFHWGFGTEATFLGDLSYKGTFTKFDFKGTPVEGTYSITITESQLTNQMANDVLKATSFVDKFLPMASPDRSKCKVVQSGVSLWDIARAEYNDEDQWKNIARTNKISDPLDIEPGKIVKVPAIT